MKKRKVMIKPVSEKKYTILVVDDEQSLRDSMEMFLSPKYNVAFAASGKEALEKVSEFRPDCVLLDIRLPEMDGIEVLKKLRKQEPDLDVVMVTALNTVKNAVDAIKAGAYDYITKPFDIEVVSSLIEKILERRTLMQENRFLKDEINKKFQFQKIVGRSEEMREVFSLISQVAENDSTVYIQGESGTGKELAARAIHDLSKRSNKLFVPINCAAIPDNLLESELFGHERGAFTGAIERKLGKFEIAQGGTIFLDEVGCLPLPLQSKLLRVIQERELERIGGEHPIPIDVRIISASNKSLRSNVKKGEFRLDLFYRLHVIPITLPPLRDRKKDIPLLTEHFLAEYNAEFGKNVKGFDEMAQEALLNYYWPGNVRELQNLVERLVALSQSNDLITVSRLPREIIENEIGREHFPKPEKKDDMDFKKAYSRFEAAFLKKALEKTHGKKQEAAGLMGVHRNTVLNMHRRLKKYLS